MRTRMTAHRRPFDDTPDTEEAFRRLASLPEGRQRDMLRDDIVVAWLPMAERLAGRFRDRGESDEDLRQVAALGLVKAVDRYDPGRGHAFESYAVPTVTGEIKRHFRDHLWVLHVPRRVQNLRNRVRSACRDLTGGVSDRLPGVAEIAEHARLSEEDVRAGLEALESFSALSLDVGPRGVDGQSLGDRLGTADPALDVVVDREAVKPLLTALPERERAILYLRFFKDMSQSSIAEEFGISQMHVSRLISRSCRRIREEVLRDTAERDAVGPATDRPAADPSAAARRRRRARRADARRARARRGTAGPVGGRSGCGKAGAPSGQGLPLDGPLDGAAGKKDGSAGGEPVCLFPRFSPR